ncbi:MAG: hypothetical protein M3068_12535 [Gemmatimonadota bacterium]|nr:hypothetical protein [Gemmatimonadota bacterium]
MKRLAVAAALLMVAACKSNDAKGPDTAVVAPAMTPAPADTGMMMKKDTGMMMKKDTGMAMMTKKDSAAMKKAAMKKDTTMKMKKKP